jgi:hypothetical protein
MYVVSFVSHTNRPRSPVACSPLPRDSVTLQLAASPSKIIPILPVYDEFCEGRAVTWTSNRRPTNPASEDHPQFRMNSATVVGDKPPLTVGE